MDDVILAARSELAFLKALADDRGAIPPVLGWHLIAIGAVFGLDFIQIWAVHTDLLPWPPAYRWLVRYAARFGFVNYAFEPWHWEWVGRISR